jgi:uncharacterized HAD superfamily protein
MNMTSIYIDIDDVLAESCQTFLHVLEREFDKKVSFSQITDFDLKKSFGLTDEEYQRFFDCIHQPDEMICHTPVPGARSTVQGWHDRGYEICILTGRPADAKEVSVQWLERHAFSYHRFQIVNKYGRKGSEGNGSISLQDLSRHSFDLAVEDSAQMAVFLSETMQVPVALLDRPWNRGFSFGEKVHRCRDWQEIQDRFSRFE